MKRLVACFCLMTLSTLGDSHPGDLDNHGCHANLAASEYHCHYGVLAGKTFTSEAQMQQVLQKGSAAGTQPRYYQGQVIAIIDGDHIKARVNNTVTVLRLAEIDAPEIGQPGGMKAKQFIGNLLFNKQIRIQAMGKDSSNTPIARVYLDKVDVNALLVEKGHAWADIKHLQDRNLVRLEAMARNQRRGLWATGQATPPWHWREQQQR